MELKQIATFCSPLKEKFGAPRQAGLAGSLRGRIVFEPAFRDANLLRGLEGFDMLWLIWGFSANRKAPAGQDEGGPVRATARPPRLGGNAAMGILATRSPYRPNPIGLSALKIIEIIPSGPQGPEIVVAGADLIDGTPIYDIKPYIPYADAFPSVRAGFVDDAPWQPLEVGFAPGVRCPAGLDREALIEVLSQDPRPQYQCGQDGRRYGLTFGDFNVRFSVSGKALTIESIGPEK